MFDTAASQQPIANSIDWITGTLLGDVAGGLCVLAVAFVGFSMLTGRLSIRRGAMVLLGCFVLLGAPIMANGLLTLWAPEASTPGGVPDRVIYEAQPRAPLPPAPSPEPM